MGGLNASGSVLGLGAPTANCGRFSSLFHGLWRRGLVVIMGMCHPPVRL